MKRYLPVVWLAALSVYVLLGVPVTPFHGDEAMHITMSADYTTAILQGNIGALAVEPPYQADSLAWLRLLNGSLTRYTIGLSAQLAGYSATDLPSLWVWPISYEDNLARGNRPSAGLLNAGRWPSALFLCASLIVLFALADALGGRFAAYFAAGLYALHPVILLNGRRAMQEGALLFFGMLTLWLVMRWVESLSTKKENAESLPPSLSDENGKKAPIPFSFWKGVRGEVLLGLAAGLTLASKHSGVVFIAGAFGWLLIAGWQRGAFRHVLQRTLIAAVITLLVFIACSPALWSNVPARLRDLLNERQSLLNGQVSAAGGATTLEQRLSGLFTQPFSIAPQYFEATFWGGSPAVQAEIRAYEASGLGGIQWGRVFGAAWMLCAVYGLWRVAQAQSGFLAWVGVTVTSLLVNPLLWQRYSLPLLPITTLLAALGFSGLWRGLRR